jgi:signal transduction histidine kinase
MREAVSAMDGFINGIVHDINTPLSVIRMNAQSITKAVKDEKIKIKASRLLQGVEQVESLEQQLLFSVKVGQYELQKESFDLGSIIQERKHYYSSLRKSIDILIKSEPYEVFADKSALLRMVDNIVLNAIKYSRTKRKVYIELHNNNLIIKDEGVGIKYPKKVFDKYYREAKESKGIGLGLYIVAEVAKLHNIAIDVDSKLGVGTSFKIKLFNISTSKLH